MLDFIIHIDKYLGQIISTYGGVTYAILFVIIFVETGLVFTPFLPGDSLLFAAGTFAALGSLNIWWVVVLLSVAAVAGDTVNYWIGHFFGARIPIKKDYLEKTQNFFDKHGNKTIFLARFVPIVRTFAPFVAGIGKMHYAKFISYNIFGGLVWVALFTFTGYFFGNIPFVKHNFSLVILVIIALSLLPMLFELLKNLAKKKIN